MKVWVLLGAFVLTACAPYQTLEELEHEALVTGDWSAVEARESIIARRAAREAQQCPKGYMSYCESMMARKRCGCVQNEIMMQFLYGR